MRERGLTTCPLTGREAEKASEQVGRRCCTFRVEREEKTYGVVYSLPDELIGREQGTSRPIIAGDSKTQRD